MPLLKTIIQHWEKAVWQQPDSACLLCALLAPLSGIYGHFSSKPPSKISSLPCPVISVGNLTVGGSGKSPMTMLLAKLIQSEFGRKVAVISRGYRKDNKHAVTVLCDGSNILCSPRQAGDEAFMLASRTLASSKEGAIVITAPNRYAAGKVAIEEYGAEVILLDDGFQHRRLSRNLDIVMIDTERGFGNGRCLPGGPLREPLGALDRADWIVLYSRPSCPALDVKEMLPPIKARILEVSAVAGKIQRLFCMDKPELQPIEPQGEWLLVSGIANSKSFEQSAQSAGVKWKEHIAFEDHHHYVSGDWRHILVCAAKCHCAGVLTTEKDLWKMYHAVDNNALKALESLPLAMLPLELTLGTGKADFIAALEEST